MPSATLGDKPSAHRESSDEDEIEDSLIIGIDFGTTYSGVAWATRVDWENKNINFITSWPGTGREEGKVPTELWYDDDEQVSWGYEVPTDANPFRWFKLLLLHPEDLDPELRESDFVVRARQMMKESGKTAVSLVADYLRLLWEHIMSTIERARGEAVVEALPIHIVLTVPAIWKCYARQSMENAAKRSGILNPRLAGATKLTFAPEPEAAALAALYEQGSGVRPGNVYIVCDAGGGTVDLISYKVQSIRPTVLQEAVEGTGKLCGGIFIDQAFEQLCKGCLGHTKWNRLSARGLAKIMKDEWEYGIKPQFRPGKTGREYIVELPVEVFDRCPVDDTKREPYIKNGRIHFLGHDIEKAFVAVVADIEKLIKGQIRRVVEQGLSVTGIILVGGLGGSPYLYDSLKAVHSGEGIAVLQSNGLKPRTAICRGAVMKGFLEDEDGRHGSTPPINIASTVSRASYGIDFQAPFDPVTHLEEDKIWDKYVGIWKATNQMRWYIQRGQTVSTMKPVRASWYRLYEEGNFDGTFSIDIFHCFREVSPARKMTSVQKLGTLKCNLDVQYSDLPKYESVKLAFVRKLEFELELLPSGASVEFVVYIGGRKQGSEKVNISFA
ncbi:hypothetical protein F4859DRAFT_473995 [Xylaria cf. heliscus]|nr:hypothetical protein F4859DRAFT_473995 [Xylaria cf. heliscus]